MDGQWWDTCRLNSICQLLVEPYLNVDDGVYAFQTGVWITVISDVGFVVRWDGGTRVRVTLQPHLMNEVVGLLGTYDGVTSNDFTTAAGNVEQDAVQFARSWKTNADCQDFADAEAPVEDACVAHPYRRAWAEQSCRLITKSALFAECRAELGTEAVARYHGWCQTDTCACDSGGDCECLCTAIAAFADACAAAGHAVRWRSASVCREWST